MKGKGGGFTLMELLTVIAVITVLAALLFPVLGRVKRRAMGTVDVSNMHSIFISLTLYEADNLGADPKRLTELKSYLTSDQVLISPLDTNRTPMENNQWTDSPLVPCVGAMTPLKISYPYLHTFLEIDDAPAGEWQRLRADSRVGILASPWLGDPVKYPHSGASLCGQPLMNIMGPIIIGPIQRINMDGSLYTLPRGSENIYGGGTTYDLFITRV